MTAPAAMREPQPSTKTGHRRLNHFGYRPALDGLRGLAVAAVLLFHHGIGWATGGYLGVSAFFTLSGFLITTLLLTEQHRSGGLDLKEFWARRFRRLLPAALAAVLLALGYMVAFGDAVALERFRGDALATIGYVANWRFVLSDLSYADLFAGESPLQHMWSLAIEEQFYLFLPVIAAVAVRGRSHPARRLAALAGLGLATSIGLNLLLAGGDRDRLYYGTDTRAVELFVGVLLACLYHDPRLFRRRSGPVRTVAGALALVGMAVGWSTVAQDTGWLHPWGLLLHACLTGAVVLAACDDGPMSELLSVRPLTALGRISYGVYLYHWPLYLWLTPERTGVDGAALLALRVAATLVVSTASAVLLEHPIRYQRVRFPVRGAMVTGGALAACAVLVVGATAVVDRDPDVDFAAAEDLAEDLRSDQTPREEPADPPVDRADERWELPADRAARISIFGDSTALLFVPGLLAWDQATPSVELWEGFAALGCGVTRGGQRLFEGDFEPVPEFCQFDRAWTPVLDRSRPDIAIVELGVWDIVERKLPGDDTVRTIGDPEYDAYLVEELRAANELLVSRVPRVVWVLQPPPARGILSDDDPVFQRTAEFNALLEELFADHPQVGLVDAAGWLESIGRTDDFDLRPDGTHFSDETSVVLAEWLGPAILEAAATSDIVRADGVTPVDLEP